MHGARDAPRRDPGQGEYRACYRRLVALGGRVRWSDLRMSLADFQEPMPAQGVVLSNWEI